MTVANMFKTTGKALRYTGQCMLFIQTFEYIFKSEKPNPFRQLWDEKSLKELINAGLIAAGLTFTLAAIILKTIPYHMLYLYVAPTIALIGLGLSYLGQKLDGDYSEAPESTPIMGFAV